MAEAAKSPPQAPPGLVSPQLVKVYVIALVLVILAELIGFARWTPVEKITILLVPFVHTIWLAVLFAPQAAGRWVKVYTISDSTWAAGIILVATYPLMVRYGTLVGPNVPKLMQAGLALILQEAGNYWGAIVMAMPIGIMLGLRREVIGACYSVAREPNLSLIADIYGLDSPEGRGVIGTYITGTVLGTAFYSILGSVFALTAPAIFHPLALAMAMGVGSASMMTAGAATLGEALPQWKDEILAFAAASNLITGITGLYASWLIGLPFAEWVYRVMGKKKEPGAKTFSLTQKQERPKIDLKWTFFHLMLICILTLIGNWVATKVDPVTALPGMLFIFAICVVGVLLAKFVPFYVPTIAYIGTISLILTMPGMPYSKEILAAVGKVNFLALATPIIAFTSLSIAKDLDAFRKQGWRIVLAALITLFTVFFSAVLIAEVCLRIQGFPR
jgi:MFS family permease